MIQINTSLPYIGYLDSQIGGRAENQDSCGYADTDLGLLIVVCDGMGGGPGGRTASSMAVSTVIDYVSSASPGSPRNEVLRKAIAMAHETLLVKQAEVPSLRGMGTTVVALLINEYSALVAHAGDSRLYQYRRGSILFRTADHSMVAELVRNRSLTEEQARLSSQSNVITRALGHGEICEPDISELPYEAKDRFFLCTDGIWGMMPQKQLVKLTASTSSLAGVVESTVIQVNENGKNAGGHHDNLTMVIIETRKNSKLKQKMSTIIRNILLALTAVCILSILGNVVMYKLWSSKPEVTALQQQDIDRMVAEGVQEKVNELERQYADRIQNLQKKMSDLAEEKQQLEEQLKKVTGKAPESQPEETEDVSSSDYEELNGKLDYIIGQLKQLKNKSKSTAKNKQIDELAKYIDQIMPDLLEAGIMEDEIIGKDGIKTWLNNDIAKHNPKDTRKERGCEGHYNLIIKKVESLKVQLNKNN